MEIMGEEAMGEKMAEAGLQQAAVQQRQEIMARMGKFVVSQNPDILLAIGLGSCVGAILYDSNVKVGGIAHVMLPDSTRFMDHTDKDKFADVAIPKMMDEMVRFGARKENIVAKMAGGAQMFAGLANTEMDISRKNVEAVKAELKKEGIPLSGEDTGSDFGRTVRLDTVTGQVEISTKMREKVYYI